MIYNDLVIVYNGEVYNFKIIREELKKRGYIFTSESDTEVILKAYYCWGDESILKFDGIFAMAIWNNKLKRLFMAIDRMGIKPLYYSIINNRLLFASEIKSFLPLEPALNQFHDEVLEEYLIFRYVAGDRTLLKNIYRFLPGEQMAVQNGNIKKKLYWSLPISKDDRPDKIEDQPLLAILRKTVTDQMVSDVPVGTLSSGGVDSSLVTAIASEYKHNSLHTFSVGFPGMKCDESFYSNLISRHLNTNHHNLDANPDMFADDLVKLTYYMDEPICHENSIFVYEISRLARDNGVIVLLTGEGADELFAGYHQVTLADRLTKMRRFKSLPPKQFWRRLEGTNSPNRFVRWASFLCENEDDLALYATAHMPLIIAQNLLGKKVEAKFEYRRLILNATKGQSLPERVRWLDLALYLIPILLRQDKMSMATSVESRVPMLGCDIVDWACRQPFTNLFKSGAGKLPLRTIGYKMLPSIVIDRPKIGFAIPMAQWFKGSQRLASFLSILDEPNAYITNYLNRKQINILIDDFNRGRADRIRYLWILLALELWLKEISNIRYAR